MNSDPALPLATDLIAKFEGFRAAPYRDEGGVWTIGYGTTYLPTSGHVTSETPPLTEPQARALLSATVASTLARVRKLVTVPITDAQAASLCSLGYNIGVAALAGSTLLRRLNVGDYAGAAEQFGAWVHVGARVSPGLVKRRAAEAAAFAADPDESADDLNAQELKGIPK